MPIPGPVCVHHGAVLDAELPLTCYLPCRRETVLVLMIAMGSPIANVPKPFNGQFGLTANEQRLS